MINKFKIGNIEIGEKLPPVIIVELGINHNGSLDGWWEQHYRGGVPREIEYKTLYKDGLSIQLTEQF